MGLGKTKLILDNISALLSAGAVDAAVIISDKGVYQNWPKREVPTHFDLPHVSFTYSATMGQAKFQSQVNHTKALAESKCFFFLFMNIDAITTARGKLWLDHVYSRCGRVFTCIDESTSIKTHNAVRTKEAIKLGAKSAYTRILTGTPMTQSPLDLYSQMLFLDAGLSGFTSYYAFRNNYANIVNRILAGGRSYPEIIGYRNLDRLTERLAPVSSRLTKADCLDLPPKVYEVLEVEWTPEQRRIYKEMKKHLVAELEKGEIVSAASAMTAVNKLHQIACGWIKAEDETVKPIPHNRMEVFLRLVENVQGKAVVWCRYQNDVRAVCGALQGIYGSESVVHYFGETSMEQREEAITRFQGDPECRFFVGTAATGGKGITLTAATTVIYYSNSYSLEQRLQSEDRAHRIGQDKSVTYVDLVLPESVDNEILLALQQKEDLAESILGRLKDFLTGPE